MFTSNEFSGTEMGERFLYIIFSSLRSINTQKPNPMMKDWKSFECVPEHLFFQKHFKQATTNSCMQWIYGLNHLMSSSFPSWIFAHHLSVLKVGKRGIHDDEHNVISKDNDDKPELRENATRGANQEDTLGSSFPHHDVCISLVRLKCFYFHSLCRSSGLKMCESSSNCGSTVKTAPFPMAYCVGVQLGKWKRKAEDDDKSEAISWCRTFCRIHCNDFRVLLLLTPGLFPTTKVINYIGSDPFSFPTCAKKLTVFLKKSKVNFYRGETRFGMSVSAAIISLLEARLVN